MVPRLMRVRFPLPHPDVGGGSMDSNAVYWMGIFFSFWFFLGISTNDKTEIDTFTDVLASILGALFWIITIPYAFGVMFSKIKKGVEE